MYKRLYQMINLIYLKPCLLIFTGKCNKEYNTPQFVVKDMKK